MSARNSPYYMSGFRDGAADYRRNPRVRHGYAADFGWSWMYRRGFARGFLAAAARSRAEKRSA